MTTPTPDDQARRDALRLDHSVVLRAPAGSGKTGLLIQRMLSALAVVDQPENVLAITFTRKAAAEIQHRLIEALKLARKDTPPDDTFAAQTWALARQVRARDQAQSWHLIDNPARINATTIDALNRELASSMPVLSGLGSVPEPLEDASGLYREAIASLFARLEQPGTDDDERRALQQVLALGQNRLDKLLDGLSSMLATREQWLRACLSARGQDHEVGERLIRQHVNSMLKQVMDRLPDAHCRHDWLEALRSLAADGAAGLEMALELDTWPAADMAHLAHWQWLSRTLLTTTGTWRSPRGMNVKGGFIKGHPATAQAKQLIENFAACGDTTATALHNLSSLPDGYPQALSETAAALNRVLLQLCGELRLIFANRQKADYAELAIAALDALADTRSGVAERQHARIQHLLVDEMQDTSDAQHQLLIQLVSDWAPGDGRSLFLVGDPQQSIYLFRQARVELFQQVFERARLGPVELTALQLSSNFRSRPALVQWCNTHMHALFTQRSSPVSFASSMAQRSAGGDGVEVVTTQTADEEAHCAAQCIAASLAQDSTRTIGVLARSRAHFQPLIQALSERGIAYCGQDLDPLAHTPVARDYLACVQALRHPADDLAWARLLRSPGIGLSWATLDSLAAEFAQLSWSQRARRADEPRLARLQACLHSVEQRPGLKGNLPLAASWLHRQLGMRDDLTGPETADLLRLETLLRSHCPNGSLEDEHAFQAAVQRLFSQAPPARVELMTVHRSKGLEFDHVVLFGCNAGLRRADSPLLRYEQREADWLLAPRPRESLSQDTPATRVYKLLNAQAQADDAAEALRLFYVACTRARERLDITLNTSQRGDKRNFAALLADSGETLELKGERQEREVLWRPVMHPRLPPERCQPQQPRQLPHRQPSQTASPSRLASVQRDRVAAGLDWSRLHASLIGTLVHECLERIAQLPTLPDAEQLERWRGPLRAGLSRRGLPDSYLDEACDHIIELTLRALNGWGSWLLAPRSWARDELALAGWQSDEWVSAIIDRCFEDDQQRCWVVDYKTNAAPSLQVSAWLQQQCQHYDQQLARYVALMGALRPQNRAIGALYFIACDALMIRTQHGWQQVFTHDEISALTAPAD